MIDTRARLDGTDLDHYSLARLKELGIADTTNLPKTIKILLEMLLRDLEAGRVDELSVRALASWPAPPPAGAEVPFTPSRVLMQDYTGVPAVVDLAAMRSAMQRAGKDPEKVEPVVPVDLVIDHSVQADFFGASDSYSRNIEREYQRNGERYALLNWAQQAFGNFTVVPPGMGICHQVNLENLSRVVQVRETARGRIAIPDTLVGTDSHTTMVNGVGVLGWGVGGIEAEAAMLGQAMYLPPPIVIGVKFNGKLPAGSTATDLVLTLTEMLRKHGVVNKFVEFCGDGLSSLSVPDRATMSNMCPEYGATAALFPVDRQALEFLETTGRPPELIELVQRYCRAQGLFREDGDQVPVFSELLELDLDRVEPSLAGPKRPQDRVPLAKVYDSFNAVFAGSAAQSSEADRFDQEGGSNNADNDSARNATAVMEQVRVEHGSVVVAAITSCTNTSNPSVMIGAGLLAKKAVEKGLTVQPYVKTSLAPGSRVVTDYLKNAGLLEHLETLGFYLVGYGCTTCIGNTGPLATPEIEAQVQEEDLAVAAVLSGNRNFEARIHPLVKANYLASPPLVVAYALAGNLKKDLTKDPLGNGKDGRPVYLKDIWPTQEEVNAVVAESVRVEMFKREYEHIYDGDENWRRMTAPTGATFEWDERSTYVQEPPYFEGLSPEAAELRDIEGARVLVILGDSVTTDHISPAGSIGWDSPAGLYLRQHGVDDKADFNSYGARRGNHEVMMRGTFANVRLRNELAEGREGYYTRHLPDGEEMTIFDAAARYREEGVPLIGLAGKEYGSGSSRDWAAKGPLLLGFRAVIAESFERIHRSNLVGMGVLPLQFVNGENRKSLGLTGAESYSIRGLGAVRPQQQLTVEARSADGSVRSFQVQSRLDNQTDVEYLRHGGILSMVLRGLLKA